MEYDLIVLGGGAAGLAAAAAFERHQNGARAAVIEKEPKLGRKLLATGNGRCNLTNMNMSAECYNKAAASFMRQMLSRMTPERLIKNFEQLGLLCRADDEGRVYPLCSQSSAVLDVLTMQLENYGTDIFCNTRADSIKPTGGGFLVTAGDSVFSAKTLILAAGGKVQSALGSDGSSYVFAAQLGLECSPVFPSLAPVIVNDKNLHCAKGVRTAAHLTLVADGRAVCSESGELQLNEKNISGICVFQLSRLVNEFLTLGTVNGKKCGSLHISADLLPTLSEEDVYVFLRKRWFDLPQLSAGELFTGLLNKKLGEYIMKSSSMEYRNKRLSDIHDARLHDLAHKVKNCKFVPSAQSAPNAAQVTSGGITLSLIDRNMRCTRYNGLYIIGEALDADGICGGYNLHFAFSGGIIAGVHAAKSWEKKNDKNKRA